LRPELVVASDKGVLFLTAYSDVIRSAFRRHSISVPKISDQDSEAFDQDSAHPIRLGRAAEARGGDGRGHEATVHAQDSRGSSSHFECGCQHRQIALACDMSPSTVSGYLSRAESAGLTWQRAKPLSDAEVEARLFSYVGRSEPVPGTADRMQRNTHLTEDGRSLPANRLTQLVREYVAAAGTGKKGACPLFRHTTATVMLESGADIRYIQEMLGHVELSTTQIYTQVSIRQLKAVHALTHPSAKLERRPAPQRPELAKTTSTREELFLFQPLRPKTNGSRTTALDGAATPPSEHAARQTQVLLVGTSGAGLRVRAHPQAARHRR
jgi:hypothetical protein